MEMAMYLAPNFKYLICKLPKVCSNGTSDYYVCYLCTVAVPYVPMNYRSVSYRSPDGKMGLSKKEDWKTIHDTFYKIPFTKVTILDLLQMLLITAAENM